VREQLARAFKEEDSIIFSETTRDDDNKRKTTNKIMERKGLKMNRIDL